MVETHNKRAYLAGLVVDANRNPFGELHTLLGLANTVDVRTAKRCALCDSPGLFSTALFATDPNSTVDLVGHSDKYTVLCRECHVIMYKSEISAITTTT